MYWGVFKNEIFFMLFLFCLELFVVDVLFLELLDWCNMCIFVMLDEIESESEI